MIKPLFKLKKRRVLIDIDTQRDLFLANGNNCIGNHRRVLANIRRVLAWARHNNVRTISTELVTRNGNGKKHACLEGTRGQNKISYTLRSNRISFPAKETTDLPKDILRQYDQVIFRKRSENPFDEPRIDRLLSELRADEFIILGASLEGAVKATALGLLHRGKKVRLVIDATGSHDKRAAQIALRQIQAKGAKLIETKSLAGNSHLNFVGICNCKRCLAKAAKTSARTAATAAAMY